MEAERKGTTPGNKERKFASEIPIELPGVCLCLERWIPFHPKPRKTNLHPQIPFSLFLILCPRPSPTPYFSLPGPPSLALPVLPNSLFNEYLYFLFLAAPLWIQLWPYNIYHMFCPFHSAMKEAILQQSQMRFLSPINLAVKQRTVTVQQNKERNKKHFLAQGSNK